MTILRLISRRDAKSAGQTRYFTGKPCSNGHIAERRVSDFNCMMCRRLLRRVQESHGGSQRLNFQKRRREGTKKRQRDRGTQSYIRGVLRRRLLIATERGQRAGSAVRDLGCSIPEFKNYIAAQFQPGMSWDNHGEWHLDHIRPLASFDLIDRIQFLVACHFTNYQPLWANDNAAKGALV